MQDAEQVSSLVGDIYDAVLDPALWPSVLQALAGFVGGSAASLFRRDTVRKAGNAYHAYGTEPLYEKSYFDKYIRFDPLDVVYLCLNVGDVASNSSMIPHAEFIETRFYKEWVQPQGLIDNVFTIIDKSSTGVACFCVFRHERDGFTDDDARRRMRLIAPHVRRSVLISKVIELKTAEAATFADAFDGLAAGLFLVDAKARIVHTNAAGHAMLAAGHVLTSSDGRLTARGGQMNEGLTHLLSGADGVAAIEGRSMALTLMGRDGERYVAHGLPLTSGARRRTGATYAATMALFVHKADLGAPSPLETIAKTFKLTPAELRVLIAVIEVGGAPEAADALGIAESTVRWHLRHLFEKTGAARQADLVKLVAGYANPLLP